MLHFPKSVGRRIKRGGGRGSGLQNENNFQIYISGIFGNLKHDVKVPGVDSTAELI